MPDSLMPAAFIGHGSPANALETNRWTTAWRAFGASLPRPRAVLVVSAHWFIGETAVTHMTRPRTIHDLYGFGSAELNAFAYGAPGAPDVAREVADVLKPRWVGLDDDAWGLDHGAWSVLAHVLPAADVPVVELSLNGHKPLEYHFELGTRLAALRARGIAVLCSGNVVHDLRRADPRRGDEGFDWAVRFDEAARERMTTAPADVLALREHPDFTKAVPTPEHFVPLVYLAGLAAAGGANPSVLVDGYAQGSLSMTSFVL